MDPLAGLEVLWRDGWAAVLAGLDSLNPVPPPVRRLVGSRVFWLAVWLALGAGIFRALLGRRAGPPAGLVAAGATWAAVVRGGWIEVVLAAAAAGALALLSRSRWGRRARGLKRCPDCAEDVRAAARVCRHCRHSFEPRSSRPLD